MRAFSELPEALRGMTFETLEPRTETADVVAEARRFAKGESDAKWLVMSGSVGWGKTHIGISIINERIDHPEYGGAGKYVFWLDFLTQLQAGFDDGTYHQTLDRYRDVPLLMVDNLKSGGKWADERLLDLLDWRYIRRLETIVTLNTMRGLDTPVQDRLEDIGTGLVQVFAKNIPSYRTGEVRV